MNSQVLFVYGAKKIRFAGWSYTLSARFSNGQLDSVLLGSGMTDRPRDTCFEFWRRAVSTIQEKYGPPDVPVVEGQSYAPRSIERDFTFGDGNQIGVISSWLMEKMCLVNIAYVQVKGDARPKP